MTATAFREDNTKALLRPAQMEEMTDEISRLERLVGAPTTELGMVVQKGVDRGAALRRLRALKRDHDQQAPLPYKSTDLDLAVRRRKELLDTFTNGMPTQAEMRRNPAGAVDKHRAWERRNKKVIAEFKNIELRLHASGGSMRLRDEVDVANIERFRPVGGSGELNMHNEQITGKSFFIPPNLEVRNVMSDEDREAEEAHTLESLRRMAVSSPAARKALAILEAAAPEGTGNDAASRKEPELNLGSKPLEMKSPAGDD